MTNPRKRVLLFAAKLGYQTRMFDAAAKKLDVELAFVTDRCHQLNDPWGDLVNYFRDLTVTQVKYRLLANAVNELAQDRPALSETEVKPTAREVMETALPE